MPSGVRKSRGVEKSRAAPRIASGGFGKPVPGEAELPAVLQFGTERWFRIARIAQDRPA